MMTKSELFTQYNKAKAAAKQGKLDAKRVDRALGIAQSKNYPHSYQTTIKSCNCVDHRRNPNIVCKHMVKKMMEVRIDQSHVQPAPVQPKVIYVELEWDGIDPKNVKSEWQYAKACKMSIGKGLLPVSIEKLIDTLTGYEVIKVEFISRNRWGTNNFKMWWERK
jgi:hypothetical protein